MISGSAFVSTIADGRDAEPARFVDGVLLPRRVDDDESVGELRHFENAFEVAAQFGGFATEGREFLFAHLFVVGRGLDLLDIFQTADAFADGREIGQGAAEPALVDVKLSASHGRFLDRFLRLLFAADEKNLAAAMRHILKKISRALQLLRPFHRD